MFQCFITDLIYSGIKKILSPALFHSGALCGDQYYVLSLFIDSITIDFIHSSKLATDHVLNTKMLIDVRENSELVEDCKK